MPVTKSLATELSQLAARTRLRVLGLDLLKNDAEARLCRAVLHAYGEAERGFLYVTPTLAKTKRRPPDLVLGHPDVGVLIFEAKGHQLDEIQNIEAGYLHILYENQLRPINVIRQSEEQLYLIQDAITRLLPNRWSSPLINAVIAFPNIALRAWQARGYHEHHPMDSLLFSEQIDEPAQLRAMLDGLVRDTLQLSKKEQPITEEHWLPIAKAFGNSDVINPPAEIRLDVDERCLGAYVDEVQSTEKYLSEEQKELIQLRIGGFPRVIRGVAGSGKTVVLAALAARYLHSRYPEDTPRMAVTCFNRTLVPFLQNRIEAAWQGYGYLVEMPLVQERIVHFNGLLWKLAEESRGAIKPILIRTVSCPIKRAQLYCNQLKELETNNPARYHALCFDAIFVDEAQDFAPEEFALLLALLRPHPETGEKNLILCYDDAQNLYGRQRPVWRNIGINVAIGDRSRVMRYCFRNSRQTVELAFNVLTGTQAPPDLRVHTRQYADVGYLREHNLITEEETCFRIHFADRNDVAPIVQTFSLRHAELDWVVAQVVQLIKDEAVRPEDILLLTPMPRAGAVDVDYLERQFHKQLPAIPLYFAAAGENKDAQIFAPNRLTLSTVFSAKGYDAPIVFVFGTDLFPYTKEGRAAFYVAATRAKLRLYLSGMWRDRSLLNEAAAMRAHLSGETTPLLTDAISVSSYSSSV